MNQPPQQIDGMEVVLFSVIDWRHNPTDRTSHVVGGEPLGPAAALAICRDRDDSSYYLLYCNEAWESITDTWHETLEDAKAQAGFEYEGIDASWEAPRGA